MEFSPYQIAFAANIALGAFLLVTAALVARRLQMPGSGWLALYLALVGINYTSDGFRRLFDGLSALEGVALVASILDPVPLLFFALALRRGTTAPWVRVAVALPSIFVATYAVLTFARPANVIELRTLSAMIFAPYYMMALALAAQAHHASRSANEQDLRARLVIALAVITLCRIPLIATDLGYVGPASRHLLRSIYWLDLPLLLLTTAFIALFVWSARPTARASARRVAVQVALLVALVDAVWLLRFTGALGAATYALLYSIRWFVFAGLLTLDLRRFELLGVPSRLGATARTSFAALLGILVFTEVTAFFLVVTSLGGALLGASIVTMPLVISAAVALHRSRYESASVDRRSRIYRAHLELGASDAELAGLREQLGLTQAEVREESRLAALEARIPPEGRGRPTVGSVFARRYDVLAVVGSGVFGLVFDAFDRIEGRRVVLKELRADWRASPDAAAQLQREAKTLLRVSNPHLVRMTSLERAAEGHVLVLEHVEGETLRARLGRGPHTPAEASRLAADVLDALATLHAARVLHRDVKPENIVLRPSGDAVLIDLGAAGVAAPAYMSPEQLRSGRMSPASDIYALGVVLWESLTLEQPPAGDVPAAWKELLAKSMAADPSQRFEDADAFRAALPPG